MARSSVSAHEVRSEGSEAGPVTGFGSSARKILTAGHRVRFVGRRNTRRMKEISGDAGGWADAVGRDGKGAVSWVPARHGEFPLATPPIQEREHSHVAPSHAGARRCPFRQEPARGTPADPGRAALGLCRHRPAVRRRNARSHRGTSGAARQGWHTIEAQVDMPGALGQAAERPVLVDCLTLWLTNVMLAGHDIAAATDALEAALSRRPAPTILVGNEVGLGLVPDTPLGRRSGMRRGVASTPRGAGGSGAVHGRRIADDGEITVVVIPGGSNHFLSSSGRNPSGGILATTPFRNETGRSRHGMMPVSLAA